jgi:hypothetical protein
LGEHPLAVADQDLARLGHAAVGGVIFLEHSLGFGHQAGFDGRYRFRRMLLGDQQHPIQSPKEIHRSRTGGGNLPANDLKARLELARVLGIEVQGSQGRAHGRRHPDGRGAANSQGADCFDDVVIIPGLYIELFRRQAPLVQQLDLIHIPTDAAIGDHFFSGFRFSSGSQVALGNPGRNVVM